MTVRFRRFIGPLLFLSILFGLFLLAPDEGSYDYSTYHVVGTLLKQGVPPAQVYHVSVLRNALKEQYGKSGLGPFFYTPVMLPLARAAALVDLEDSVRLYRILMLILLAVALILLKGETGAWWPSCLLALSYPVYVQFLYNNWTVLLFFALLIAIILEKRGHPIPAGVALAFAILLKPYTVVLLLPLFLARRGRVLGSAFISGIILCAITLPLYGLASWEAWASQILSRSGMGIYAIYNNISLPALIVRPFSPQLLWLKPIANGGFPLLTQLFILLLPLLLLLLLFKMKDSTRVSHPHKPLATRRDENGGLDVGLGLSILYLLLFAPFTWDHGYLLLLLLIGLLPRRAGLLSLLLLPTLFYYPLLDYLVFKSVHLLPLYILILTLPLIAVTVLLVHLFRI